jgi:signal transduction histidine kinase
MPPTARLAAIHQTTGLFLHTSRHLSSVGAHRGSRSRPVTLTPADSSAALAATLAERARIARELHDTLSQTLYAIALSASHGLSLLGHNQHAELKDSVADVLQLANTGQSELRALLTDLSSGQLFSGELNALLASLGAETRERGRVDIHMALAEEPDAPVAVKCALVMICREALHNIVKHAAARRVDVVLEQVGDQIVLLIADDGRGLDPAVHRPGHFGLETMRERAAAAGGTLDLVSSKDAGTQIRVCIPRGSSRNQ